MRKIIHVTGEWMLSFAQTAGYFLLLVAVIIILVMIIATPRASF